MSDHIETFCPECDEEVRAILINRPTTVAVRGEEVGYTETVAVCPNCQSVMGDARIEGENLRRAYDEYRKRHQMLSPAQITELRSSYGLSLRDFSRFLGFGEQTIYRYERGDLPDLPHNTTMLSATNPEGARLLLSQNRARLGKRAQSRVEARIKSMEEGSSTEAPARLVLEKRESIAPCAANGYRALDLERASALMAELSRRCSKLYWTKLQKAAFYADMVSYERTGQSLTGLSYAHATYGPVIDQRDEMRLILSQRGAIDFVEEGWGEVAIPLAEGPGRFSDEELSLIDEVSAFVNTFSSASELSGYSHGLGCWENSADGQIIEYTSSGSEVDASMARRLEAVGAK